MKLRNLLLYITAFTLAAINSSCKDDDDKKNPDPRLRRVIFPEFDDDITFIVNDSEGKIYNYDSLSYGTRIDSLYPLFYGYNGTENLEIRYSYDGSEFIDFRNTVAMDFTNPVKIISTNTENQSKKEYTLEIRVHNYDIDAFQWTKVGEISDLGDDILSQKSIIFDNKMWQFIQTDTECKVLTSVDGSQWKVSKIIAPEILDLSTLCNIEDSLFVQDKSGAILAADFSGLKFSKLDAINGGQLLYSLNKQIWVIDGNDIKSYSKSGELKVTQQIPDKFVADTLRPFIAPSGNTTLGYLYVKKGELAEIWGADRYGNIECLTSTSVGIPYLDKTIAFNFNNTLGIIGGIGTDGKYSTKCYTSNNSGMTWKHDIHKDLSNAVGALADAGIFLTKDKGEFVLIGGKTEKEQSNKIWALRLKKILLEEDFLNKLK